MKSSATATLSDAEPFVLTRPSPEGGRFAPGLTTIAGRYRLERRLARGGMVEVRAA